MLIYRTVSAVLFHNLESSATPIIATLRRNERRLVVQDGRGEPFCDPEVRDAVIAAAATKRLRRFSILETTWPASVR